MLHKSIKVIFCIRPTAVRTTWNTFLRRMKFRVLYFKKKRKKSLATVCKTQRGAKRTLDDAEAATTTAGPPPNWRSGERLWTGGEQEVWDGWQEERGGVKKCSIWILHFFLLSHQDGRVWRVRYEASSPRWWPTVRADLVRREENAAGRPDPHKVQLVSKSERWAEGGQSALIWGRDPTYVAATWLRFMMREWRDAMFWISSRLICTLDSRTWNTHLIFIIMLGQYSEREKYVSVILVCKVSAKLKVPAEDLGDVPRLISRLVSL